MSEGKRDWNLAIALGVFAALAVSCALFSRYSAGLAGRSFSARLTAPDAAWEPIREGAVIGRAAEGARSRYLVAMPFFGRRVIISATLRRDGSVEGATLLDPGSQATFGRRLVAAMNGPGRTAALSYSPLDRAAESAYRALGESLREAQAAQGETR